MEKRKLIIASDSFLPRWDGIASFLNDVIPRIEKDYKITTLSPDFGDYSFDYDAEIIRYKTLKMRFADNYYPAIVNPFKISKEIKKADVVWVHTIGPIGLWSIIFARKHKVPVILSSHTIEWEVFPNSQGINLLKVPLNILVKMADKYLYNRCNSIMVSSTEQAELLSIVGIRRKKNVVHLGVDVKYYRPALNKKIAKEKIGIDPDKFVIGYAGRVSLEKDPKTLYRAFIRFSKKYKDSVLLIAGGGRPDLEAMFKKNPSVVFTGAKDDLLPYYQAMDVYCLTSLSETSSLTTMEAMSCALPVIVTPVGLVKEYVDDGKNGFMISKKNSYMLFQKLEYVKRNMLACIHIGREARSTIMNNYTWDKTIKSIKKVIDNT